MIPKSISIIMQRQYMAFHRFGLGRAHALGTGLRYVVSLPVLMNCSRVEEQALDELIPTQI